MNSRSAICLVLLAVLLFNGCRKDQLFLSDDEAKSVLEDHFEQYNYRYIPLGPLTAVRESSITKPDRYKGEMSIQDFEDYQIWEQLEVVTITKAQDLSKEFTSWADWFALTQKGTQVRFVASEGPKAGGLHCSEQQEKINSERGGGSYAVGEIGGLCIEAIEERRIERIVTNEQHAIPRPKIFLDTEL